MLLKTAMPRSGPVGGCGGTLIGAALHSAVQQMLYRRDPRPFLFVKGVACQSRSTIAIQFSGTEYALR